MHSLVYSRPTWVRDTGMLRYAFLTVVVLTTVSCDQTDETTGSVGHCVAQNFPAYNPKSMDQCVAACKMCQHGVTTTCTTSCTLKGAR